MTEYSAGPWTVVAGRPGWLYIVSEELQNGVNRHIAEVPASPKAMADAQVMAVAPILLAGLLNISRKLAINENDEDYRELVEALAAIDAKVEFIK